MDDLENLSYPDLRIQKDRNRRWTQVQKNMWVFFHHKSSDGQDCQVQYCLHSFTGCCVIVCWFVWLIPINSYSLYIFRLQARSYKFVKCNICWCCLQSAAESLIHYCKYQFLEYNLVINITFLHKSAKCFFIISVFCASLLRGGWRLWPCMVRCYSPRYQNKDDIQPWIQILQGLTISDLRVCSKLITSNNTRGFCEIKWSCILRKNSL